MSNISQEHFLQCRVWQTNRTNICRHTGVWVGVWPLPLWHVDLRRRPLLHSLDPPSPRHCPGQVRDCQNTFVYFEGQIHINKKYLHYIVHFMHAPLSRARQSKIALPRITLEILKSNFNFTSHWPISPDPNCCWIHRRKHWDYLLNNDSNSNQRMLFLRIKLINIEMI